MVSFAFWPFYFHRQTPVPLDLGGGGGGVISRVCFDAAETQEASACAEDRSLVL